MFTEDLTAMFDTCHGFGVSAEYDGKAISVLFDAEYYAAPGEEVDIESAKPAVTCKSEDVAAAAIGDSIAVQGTAYTITNVRPNGTGITVLALQEA